MREFNKTMADSKSKRSRGVTLVELMIAAALFIVASGTIYTVARATFASTAYHDAEIVAQEEARRGLQYMVTELRQARRMSLTMQTLPNDMLTFQIPEDVDGNGLPVDEGGYLESAGTITYTRDFNDMNGDGLTTTQLIRVYQGGAGMGPMVTVLANDIMPNEDVNWDGTLNPGEDLNASRMLERGIWFDSTGSLMRIVVDCQKTVGEGGRRVWATVATNVSPRN